MNTMMMNIKNMHKNITSKNKTYIFGFNNL